MSSANWDPDASGSWLFVDATDPITGFDPTAFTFNYAGFLNTTNGEFSVALGTDVQGGDSSQLSIVYAAVPEPGTLVLAGLGLAGAALVIRRKRRGHHSPA